MTYILCVETKNLAFSWGIKLVQTTPYYPKANVALRAFQTVTLKEWDTVLYQLALEFNHVSSSDTKNGCLGSVYRKKLVSPPHSHLGVALKDLEEVWNEATQDLQKYYSKLSARINSNIETVSFKVRDNVFLETHFLSNKAVQFSAKLAPMYMVPFVIKRFLSPVTMISEDVKNPGIFNKFYVETLPLAGKALRGCQLIGTLLNVRLHSVGRPVASRMDDISTHSRCRLNDDELVWGGGTTVDDMQDSRRQCLSLINAVQCSAIIGFKPANVSDNCKPTARVSQESIYQEANFSPTNVTLSRVAHATTLAKERSRLQKANLGTLRNFDNCPLEQRKGSTRGCESPKHTNVPTVSLQLQPLHAPYAPQSAPHALYSTAHCTTINTIFPTISTPHATISNLHTTISPTRTTFSNTLTGGWQIEQLYGQ
ncbi:hypothetical protein PR048_025410 [Dryococelus australis]|uniref:Uncharacterized protein n=1 Tax=Dryococelus australis TaxID=614101 RepID=A0ABQ9GR73_9NEOP|nr:hypothetical protein PR048_025410 [Dryococelus australis]